nr:hypothetical protein CFP56_27533 [Quercus suber]
MSFKIVSTLIDLLKNIRTSLQMQVFSTLTGCVDKNLLRDEEEPYQEEENLHCNANVLHEENEGDDIDWSRSGVENMTIE